MGKTLLTIPEGLLEDVQRINEAPTKSKAIVVALEEYVRDKRLNRLMARMGKGFGMGRRQLLRDRKAG